MSKGRFIGCLLLLGLMVGCERLSDEQAVAKALGEQMNDQLGMALGQEAIDCVAAVHVDVLGAERALQFVSAGIVEMIERDGMETISSELSQLQQGMEACFKSP